MKSANNFARDWQSSVLMPNIRLAFAIYGVDHKTHEYEKPMKAYSVSSAHHHSVLFIGGTPPAGNDGGLNVADGKQAAVGRARGFMLLGEGGGNKARDATERSSASSTVASRIAGNCPDRSFQELNILGRRERCEQ